MKTTKYWCPKCSVTDNGDKAIECGGMDHEHAFVFMIPVVEPLTVPEETTWGESGGAEALCHWRGPGGWCYTSADIQARIVARVRK